MATAVEKLREPLEALHEENVEYILFGGRAINLHGILRFTDDIDLFIDPTPDNVERLRRALRRVWTDPSIDEICVEDLGLNPWPSGNSARSKRRGRRDGFPPVIPHSPNG